MCCLWFVVVSCGLFLSLLFLVSYLVCALRRSLFTIAYLLLVVGLMFDVCGWLFVVCR